MYPWYQVSSGLKSCPEQGYLFAYICRLCLIPYCSTKQTTFLHITSNRLLELQTWKSPFTKEKAHKKFCKYTNVAYSLFTNSKGFCVKCWTRGRETAVYLRNLTGKFAWQWKRWIQDWCISIYVLFRSNNWQKRYYLCERDSNELFSWVFLYWILTMTTLIWQLVCS